MREEYLNTINILKKQKNSLNETLRKDDDNIQKKIEIIDGIKSIDAKPYD